MRKTTKAQVWLRESLSSLWERPACCVNDPTSCFYSHSFQWHNGLLFFCFVFFLPKSAIHRGEVMILFLSISHSTWDQPLCTTSSSTGKNKEVKKKEREKINTRSGLKKKKFTLSTTQVKLFNSRRANLQNNFLNYKNKMREKRKDNLHNWFVWFRCTFLHTSVFPHRFWSHYNNKKIRKENTMEHITHSLIQPVCRGEQMSVCVRVCESACL